MAEELEPPGSGGSGGNFRPFDRQALQATLADALRDAEVADQMQENPGDDGSTAPVAAKPAPTVAAPVPPAGPMAAQPAPGAPAPVPPAAPVTPMARVSPLGRPGPAGAAGPAASPRTAPNPSAANPSRTGPSILSGGISSSLSPMAAGSTGLGGGSVSGLRPPSDGTLGGGIGARPLPGMSGMSGLAGVSPVLDEPVEEATIPLRRPNRPQPAAEQQHEGPEAGAPAPPPAPRPSVQLVAWLPTDDDILPHSQAKRRSRKGR